MYLSRVAPLRTASVLGLLSAFSAFVIVSLGEAESPAVPNLRTGLAPQGVAEILSGGTEADPRRSVRVVYPGPVASR